MGMGTILQNPMGMGMVMGINFKNGYGCRYSSTRPEPAPRPSLLMTNADLDALPRTYEARDFKAKIR